MAESSTVPPVAPVTAAVATATASSSVEPPSSDSAPIADENKLTYHPKSFLPADDFYQMVGTINAEIQSMRETLTEIDYTRAHYIDDTEKMDEGYCASASMAIGMMDVIPTILESLTFATQELDRMQKATEGGFTSKAMRRGLNPKIHPCILEQMTLRRMIIMAILMHIEELEKLFGERCAAETPAAKLTDTHETALPRILPPSKTVILGEKEIDDVLDDDAYDVHQARTKAIQDAVSEIDKLIKGGLLCDPAAAAVCGVMKTMINRIERIDSTNNNCDNPEEKPCTSCQHADAPATAATATATAVATTTK